MTDDLYKMKLHDILNFDWYEVIRVPGGWVYTRFDPNNGGETSLSSSFVPDNQKKIGTTLTNKTLYLSTQGYNRVINRLEAEVEAYQQQQDEIVVALGSQGISRSNIVGTVSTLTAENTLLRKFADAIDEEAVVTWTLNAKLTPKEQLHAIIDWHVRVATDPAVNGGYELVRVEDEN